MYGLDMREVALNISLNEIGDGNHTGGLKLFPLQPVIQSCTGAEIETIELLEQRQTLDPVYEGEGVYGGDVAGPVFREIADKCFAARVELHDPMNLRRKPLLAERQLPSFDIGNREDMQQVLGFLGLPYYGRPESEMAVVMAHTDSLFLERRTLPEGVVPSVVGMGLRDALFILENRGLKVEVDGYGKVVRQSIRPGTKARGQTVRLVLG